MHVFICMNQRCSLPVDPQWIGNHVVANEEIVDDRDNYQQDDYPEPPQLAPLFLNM